MQGLTALRRQKLEESLAYQDFIDGVEEEEAWILEKQHLLSSEDYGDTLAAVQGLLKKHDAFETDLNVSKTFIGNLFVCELTDLFFYYRYIMKSVKNFV